MFRSVISLIAAIITALTASAVSGSWIGQLKVAPGTVLKIGLNFSVDSDGRPAVTLDSPYQGALDIPGEVVYLDADSVSVTVNAIGLSFAGREVDGKLGGTLSQGFFSSWVEFSPGRAMLNRPQSPRPPFPYSTREVVITNDADGVALAGTLTLPANVTSSTPAVVMVTGSGPQNRDEELMGHRPFAVIADYLARNGIASLRYDDRGVGASTGSADSVTTLSNARDALSVVNHLRSSGQFSSIGILGHSEGCTVAFMLADSASSLYAAPSFIVALGAPAVRGDSISIDQTVTILRQQGASDETIAAQVNELKEKISTGIGLDPWLEYFFTVSPAPAIAASDCPAWVAYGERDIQVSPALNLPAMERLAPAAVIKLYPGLNHLFQHAPTGAVQEYGVIEETISPEVLRDMVRFIFLSKFSQI